MTRALVPRSSPQQVWPESGWLVRVVRRVAIHWSIKMVGNTVGMGIFFVAYFWVLHHPTKVVTVMPLTAIDRWIAFVPAAMPLYVSLWIYVSLPLALLRTRRELWSCACAMGALAGVGLSVFILFPTSVPPAGIDWSTHPSVAFLKAVDAGGNACPSLHVAYAVFAAVWLHRLLIGLRSGLLIAWLNALWCFGILYSTIATRQHVMLDVLAGITLGLAVAAVHEWMLDSPKRLRWLP